MNNSRLRRTQNNVNERENIKQDEQPVKRSFYSRLIGLVFFLSFCIVSYMKYQQIANYNSYTVGVNVDFDPYEVLQVPSTASAKEIKRAYISLSQTLHPDKRASCDKACYEQFNVLQEAYKILKNSESRKIYDETNKKLSADSTILNKDLGLVETVINKSTLYNEIFPILKYGKRFNYPEEFASSYFYAVLSPVSSSTKDLGVMLKYLSDALIGRVKFVRVNANDKETVNTLPVKNIEAPFLYLHSAFDTPAILPADLTSLPSLLNWIENNIFSTVVPFYGKLAELRSVLANQYDLDGKIILAVSNYKPSNPWYSYINALSLEFDSIFRIYGFPKSFSKEKKNKTILAFIHNNNLVMQDLVGRSRSEFKYLNILNTDKTDELLNNFSFQTMRGMRNQLMNIVKTVAPNLNKENFKLLCGGASEQVACRMSLNDKFGTQLPNDIDITVINVKTEKINKIQAFLPPHSDVLVNLFINTMVSSKDDYKVSDQFHNVFKVFKQNTVTDAMLPSSVSPAIVQFYTHVLKNKTAYAVTTSVMFVTVVCLILWYRYVFEKNRYKYDEDDEELSD
nr:dnaJ domain containing protein 1 [Dermatophagoides farinae]